MDLIQKLYKLFKLGMFFFFLLIRFFLFFLNYKFYLYKIIFFKSALFIMWHLNFIRSLKSFFIVPCRHAQFQYGYTAQDNLNMIFYNHKYNLCYYHHFQLAVFFYFLHLYHLGYLLHSTLSYQTQQYNNKQIIYLIYRQGMYRINDNQKIFLRRGIKTNIRLDGRKNNEIRKPLIQKGILNQANGSSFMSFEYENISLYTGIKLQIQKISKQKKQPTIQLCVDSIKRREKQSYQINQDQTELKVIQQMLKQLLIKYLDKQPFYIPKSQQHILKVYIDVFLLNYVHKCNIDIIFLSIKHALSNLKIPVFNVLLNQITRQQQLQLTDINRNYTSLETIPDIFLLGQFQSQLVCDLTQQQYEAMPNIFVFSMLNDKILGMRQLQGEVQAQAILKLIKFSQKIHQTHKLFQKE